MFKHTLTSIVLSLLTLTAHAESDLIQDFPLKGKEVTILSYMMMVEMEDSHKTHNIIKKTNADLVSLDDRISVGNYPTEGARVTGLIKPSSVLKIVDGYATRHGFGYAFAVLKTSSTRQQHLKVQ